ncbi:LOW QUALITY PROTEIN: hypothetical protein HZS_217 [Henneguya salminicola]|nr:LOW QUALITY PROTEIN: hypothetical protein HZS_217 [Henneguya salminicola]
MVVNYIYFYRMFASSYDSQILRILINDTNKIYLYLAFKFCPHGRKSTKILQEIAFSLAFETVKELPGKPHKKDTSKFLLFYISIKMNAYYINKNIQRNDA